MLQALSSTPLISLSAIVLDTETTGLDPQTARIIQIGSVELLKGEVDPATSSEFLIKPDIPIPPETTAIHGISDQDVADAFAFPAAIEQYKAFSSGVVVIGHNITFDLQIIAGEFLRHGLPWRRPRALCTALLARAANPTLNDYSLDNVCNWLKVEIENRHTALGDAIGTAEVFQKLIPHLAKRQIRTLAEAEGICRRFTDDQAAEIGGSGAGWLPEGERGQLAPLARVDTFPFSHRVTDIMSSPPQIVPPATGVKEVAKLLSDTGISSVLVSPKEGSSDYGIITERDVMRLVARDVPPASLTAGDVMSAPLVSIPEQSFVYKALAVMSHRKVRHLGVNDADGKIIGVLTTGSLMRQRADDALILGDKIEQAETVADLAGIWARVPFVTTSMLREGVNVRDIAAIIAEEICALTARSFSLAEARMNADGQGAAPCPYAVLVLGSGGRGETLLAPDQDNAVIYECAQDDPEVDKWFETLGQHAADILNEAGLPYCDGGVMAKNKLWRHSFSGWQNTINNWASRAEGQDLLHVDIFYDFRAVDGDMALAQKLRHFALETAQKSPALLRKMGALTADLDPVIGLFGGIITKQGRVDVKKGGLLAIVSGARVLALSQGIEEVSTKNRLNQFREFKLANDDDIANAVHAQEIILSEILRQQLDDIEAGIPPSNKVEVKRLSSHRKSELKWALEQVELIKHLTKDVVM